MKKLLLLAVPLMLTACAAGINHNVATVNGKTYLVETKVDNVIGFYQFSRPSTFKQLDGSEIDSSISKEYVEMQLSKSLQDNVESVAKECKRAARIKTESTSAQTEYNREQFYNCVMDKLAK